MTPGPVLLRRSVPPLVLVSLLAGLVAAGVAARQPEWVEVALGFSVPLPEERRPAGAGAAPAAADPVEAADLFAQTVAGWLASPDVIADAYRRAGLPLPEGGVRKLSRLVAAQQRGGQVVDVRFRARTVEEGQTLAAALRETLTERAAALTGQNPSLAFRLETSEPLVVPVRPQPATRGVVAAIVTFVFGVNLVFLWDVLRSPAPARGGVSPY